MYWYWSDDIARALLIAGKIDAELASRISVPTVALRSSEETVLDAGAAFLDDEEVPLAA
jgi:hypothetical protein